MESLEYVPKHSFFFLLATDGKKGQNSRDEKSDDQIAEQQLLIYVENNKPEDRPNTSMMNGSEDSLTVVENEGKQMNRYCEISYFFLFDMD